MKAGTGRRFLGGLLDHTSYCYTLEVSFYSYIIGGTTAAVPYTEEACILAWSLLYLDQPSSSCGHQTRGFSRQVKRKVLVSGVRRNVEDSIGGVSGLLVCL